MNKEKLSVSLTKEDRKRMADRYHFAGEALHQIDILYEAALPLVQAQAWFSAPVSAQTKEAAADAVLCAITLGDKIDLLQDLYGSVEAVTESYILECIGNTLLEKCYEALGRFLWQETGLFLRTFAFPGSQLPMQKTGDIVRELADGDSSFPISCNASYVLYPRKSVVFLGGLGEKKMECGICGNCERADCPYRQSVHTKAQTPGSENYNYGYRMILGSWETGESG